MSTLDEQKARSRFFCPAYRLCWLRARFRHTVNSLSLCVTAEAGVELRFAAMRVSFRASSRSALLIVKDHTEVFSCSECRDEPRFTRFRIEQAANRVEFAEVPCERFGSL